jgi:AcrR family transcriptional regulator
MINIPAGKSTVKRENPLAGSVSLDRRLPVNKPRRRAADDSRARTALLDAAQQLMLDEGYASVSSRRVGTRAGANPAMVYYYFDTMDGLFIELFRRGAERSLDRLARALLTPQPLWGFWEATHDVSDSALINEFIALANHRKAIRTEIASYSRKFRQIELDVLSRVLKSYGVDPDVWPAVTIILAIDGISRYMLVEEEFDIDTGHAEMVSVIERFIRDLEGDRLPDRQELQSSG